MIVHIPRSLLQDLLAYAKDRYPKESMLLLQGKITSESIIITGLLYQHHAADTHSVYTWIDQTAVSDLVGSCHSHPNENNEPSTADREFFAQHPGAHLILGYPFGMKNVQCYSHQGEKMSILIKS